MYKESILAATKCKEHEVAEVEDLMRNVILHSTLDWLSKSQFNKAAKEAYELYLFMQTDEGKKMMQEIENEML